MQGRYIILVAFAIAAYVGIVYHVYSVLGISGLTDPFLYKETYEITNNKVIAKGTIITRLAEYEGEHFIVDGYGEVWPNLECRVLESIKVPAVFAFIYFVSTCVIIMLLLWAVWSVFMEENNSLGLWLDKKLEM